MIGYCEYGAVRLELLKTERVQHEPKMTDDGTDRVTTRVDFNVTAWWNPSATAYASLVAGVPKEGVAFAGQTDAILSEYLGTPRRKLRIYTLDSNGNRLMYLESPPGKLDGDACNGPFVTVWGIKELFGVRTFEVFLTFTTYMGDCLDKITPILAHRWEKTVDIDERHAQTIVTRGTVHFHAGRLASARQSGDWYRSQFFVAPSKNFARKHVNIDLDSSGTRVDYMIVDVEQQMSLGEDSPACLFTASLTSWFTQGSLPNAMAGQAPAIGQDLMEVGGNWWYTGLRGLFNRAANRTLAIGGAVTGELPKYFCNVRCRAEGDIKSLRYNLMKFCMAISYGRIGKPSFLAGAHRSEIAITQGLDDFTIETEVTYRWSEDILTRLWSGPGPVAALSANLGLILTNDNGNRFFNSFFPDDDNFENGRLVGEPLPDGMENSETFNLTTNLTVGNRPINVQLLQDKDSRGPGFSRYLMIQALKGEPCDETPMPGIQDSIRGAQQVPSVNAPILRNT